MFSFCFYVVLILFAMKYNLYYSHKSKIVYDTWQANNDINI